MDTGRGGVDTEAYFPPVLDAFTYKGRLLGLPFSFSDVVVFYNVNLVEEAGVGAPSADWTWDDLTAAAQKLTVDKDNDGEVDQYGYQSWWWPMYVWQAGGGIVSEDGSRSILNAPETVAGIEWLRNLAWEFGVKPKPADGGKYSLNIGRVGMAADGTWQQLFLGKYARFGWDVEHHPAGPAGRATHLFSNAYAVVRGSDEVDAAQALVRFLSGAKGQTMRVHGGHSEIPTVRSVAVEEFLKNPYAPPNAHVFLEAVEYARPLPAHSRYEEIIQAIEKEVGPVWNNEVSPANAMQRAHQVVQALLDETR